MFSYIWPIGLVVLSNVFYQICSKCLPAQANPFAALTITYLVGAFCSFLFFLIFSSGGNIIKEISKMNWAPYVLGLVIVGLEVGFMYAYKAGWQVSVAPVVQSAFLSVILVVVGYFCFRESITWNKILGVIVCIGGLVLLNLK